MSIKPKYAFPREIWDKISRQLPLWSALDSSKVFGFSLDASRQKHAAVWRLIFRNNEWLQLITEQLKLSPILIGADLKALYEDSDGSKQAYLALCTPSKPNQLQAYHPAFLQSLQPHKICSDGTIAFTRSGLRLYAPLFTDPIYTIPSIRRLFRGDGKEIKSAYLDFNTSSTYSYTQFGSDFIAGKNGKNPSLDDINQMCFLKTSPSSGVLIFSTLRMSKEAEDIQRVLEVLTTLVVNCARKGFPRYLSKGYEG
jgi:hypothetical protein